MLTVIDRPNRHASACFQEPTAMFTRFGISSPRAAEVEEHAKWLIAADAMISQTIGVMCAPHQRCRVK
jgi:hypothetical protein